jgi:hypothetical protein
MNFHYRIGHDIGVVMSAEATNALVGENFRDTLSLLLSGTSPLLLIVSVCPMFQSLDDESQFVSADPFLYFGQALGGAQQFRRI